MQDDFSKRIGQVVNNVKEFFNPMPFKSPIPQQDIVKNNPANTKPVQKTVSQPTPTTSNPSSFGTINKPIDVSVGLQDAYKLATKAVPDLKLSKKQFSDLYAKYGDAMVAPLIKKADAQTKQDQPPVDQPQPTINDKAVAASTLKDFTTSKVPDSVNSLIEKASKDNNIPPAILASLLFSEHGFQVDKNKTPNKDPKTGKVLSYDRGVAQINDKAHPEITDEQAFDPNFAIPWAAKTLASHIKNLGYKKGIAAYNVGEGGAQNDEVYQTYGQAYLNKIKKGLSPQLQKELEL